MNERTKRNSLVVGAIVLAMLSIGAGALIALSDDEERTRTPSPTLSATPSATRSSAEPSPIEERSGTETAAPTGSGAAVLEDGRHFVYVVSVSRHEDGPTTIRFDLAYFLTGEEGEEAAAAHDDEFVNDYYIVNDNPRLRTLPLADDVEVRYIPKNACCELQDGSIDAWLEAVLETNPTDYSGTDAPWWLTVDSGRITEIEQQYVP